MAIVRKSMEEILQIMTEERIEQETELMKNQAVVFDEDCPELSDVQLARCRRAVVHRMAV